jgi:integrase
MAQRKLPKNIIEARGYDGYVVHLRGLDGKQYSKSFNTNDPEYGSDAEAFAQAEIWLANEKAKRRGGQSGSRRHRETLRQIGEAWYLNGVTIENWKASTRRDYRYVLDSLMDKDSAMRIAGDDTKLMDLTADHIRAWQTDLLAAGVGRRTVEKARMVLGAIFQHAVDAYAFKINPVRAVKPPKPPDDDPNSLDFFNVEEVRKLVGNAESKQDGATYLTAALANLRQGELCALPVGNVDFNKAVIRVTGSYGHGELSSTKGGKKRSVPMCEDVAKALASLLTERGNPDATELMFPGPDGGYQDGSALRRRYKRARDKAGLRPLRFHDLRHVYGSLAINRASIVQVQAWMGHADVRTTMRYLHHKSHEEDAKILDSAFAEDSPAVLDPGERKLGDITLAELEHLLERKRVES